MPNCTSDGPNGITTRQEIDTSLVERPLATLPDNNRYRVQILRRDAITECDSTPEKFCPVFTV